MAESDYKPTPQAAALIAETAKNYLPRQDGFGFSGWGGTPLARVPTDVLKQIEKCSGLDTEAAIRVAAVAELMRRKEAAYVHKPAAGAAQQVADAQQIGMVPFVSETGPEPVERMQRYYGGFDLGTVELYTPATSMAEPYTGKRATPAGRTQAAARAGLAKARQEAAAQAAKRPKPAAVDPGQVFTYARTGVKFRIRNGIRELVR